MASKIFKNEQTNHASGTGSTAEKKKEKRKMKKKREAKEGKNELASKLSFTQTGEGGEPSE